jgi:hypothetical protein
VAARLLEDDVTRHIADDIARVSVAADMKSAAAR